MKIKGVPYRTIWPTPDGKALYLICGNGTKRTETAPNSQVPAVWGEDHLLPRMLAWALLVLAPAVKVLPQLRGWFPHARLVGWKYELAGSRADAFAQAWSQLATARTDACVLNGAAYGSGFACCTPTFLRTCADANALADWLARWLER